MSKYLGTLSILTAIMFSGCGDARTNISLDAHDTSVDYPHKVVRALATDFNNDTTVSRHDRDALLSVTEVPGSGNIAIMVHTDRTDIARTEFFVDVDHDSSTGLQWTIRTTPRDVRAQADGRVGADIMVVNGTVYYYNIHQRRWRSWYHNWQRLGKIVYTSDPENGNFIIELPRNLRTAWHANANRNPEQIPGFVWQSAGDLDYDEMVANFNGQIRATVALIDANWRVMQNIENEVDFTYDPDGVTQRRDFVINEDGQNLIITLQSNEIGDENFKHADILIDADNNNATGFNRFNGIGADYLIQENHIYAHNGDVNNWRWQDIGTSTLSRDGNQLRVEVPLDQLNLQADNINIATRAINRDWKTMRNFGTVVHTVGDQGDDNGGNGDNDGNNGNNNGGGHGDAQGITVDADANSIRMDIVLNNNEQNMHFQIFIQTPNSNARRSGYLIEGTRLYQYNGDGNNWRWIFIADVRRDIQDNHLIINAPRNAVAIDGEMIVFGRIIDREWRPVRDINRVTVRANNDGGGGNGGNNNENFWFAANNDNTIFVDAQLANITPNAHTQFFLRSEQDHNRFGGYLFEDNRYYRYSGNGNNWRWTLVGESDYQRDENDEVSISIPLNGLDLAGNVVVSLRTISADWRNRRDFGAAQ